MSMLAPICGDIESGLLDEFENITYARIVEYNGEYVVALKSEPFFSKRAKIAFVDEVKRYIFEHFGISCNNIRVTFDIEILHLIKHARCDEDLDIIFKKVE